METVLWWLAQNAITVAVALPLVWVLARCRQVRPAEQHLLWVVLLVKLATPPVGQWPIPLESVRTGWTAWTRPSPTIAEPPASQARIAPDDGPEADSADEWLAVASLPLIPERVEAVTEAPAASIPQVPSISMSTVLFLVWLGGAVVVLATQVIRLLRQGRLLRQCVPASPQLQSLVDRLAERLRIRPVPVVLSAGIHSPCVSSLGRTRLLWPASLSEDLPEREAVVLHELAHVRRRDHWVRWLELAVSVVWWWNPVAWLVRAKLDETREMACDALSLEQNPAGRRRYAELLLELSQALPSKFIPAPLGAGFGVVARQSLRRRLQMIFQERVHGRTSLFGFALAGALALASLPGWTWGQAPAAKPDQPPTPQSPLRVVIAQDASPSLELKAVTDESGNTAVFFVQPDPNSDPKADPKSDPKSDPPDQPKAQVVDPKAPQPKTSDVVIRKEDSGDIVQEIPVKGNVFKLQVRRSKNGTVIIEIEGEEGTKSQTVLSIVPSAADNWKSKSAKVTVNSDGKQGFIVHSADGTVWTLDKESGKIVSVESTVKGSDGQVHVRKGPLPEGAGLTGKVSEDGKTLYVMDSEGTLRVLDAATGKILKEEKNSGASRKSKPQEPGDKSWGELPAKGGKETKEVPTGLKTSVSPEDIELAEINLQEKQLALETAREEAASSKDAKSQRSVKMAELAVRRAEIELARTRGGRKGL